MSKKTKRDVKCIVACTNAEGSPDFYPCMVEVTQEQFDNGDHYDIAKDLAVDQRYEGEMVVFDEEDGPAWFFEKVWNERVLGHGVGFKDEDTGVIKLGDGGTLHPPTAGEGRIRRRDKDGNLEEWRDKDDPNYKEWADLFKK